MPQIPTARPTILLLHTLMSANDLRLPAESPRWFNDRGGTPSFRIFLFTTPRTPRGYLNGEIAITVYLVRNAENLRQGVAEYFATQWPYYAKEGCQEFGLIGTSYGGWNGALLSFLEADFRFLALIQPIVNVEHAIWQSPVSRSMRRILRSQGIHARHE